MNFQCQLYALMHKASIPQIEMPPYEGNDVLYYLAINYHPRTTCPQYLNDEFYAYVVRNFETLIDNQPDGMKLKMELLSTNMQGQPIFERDIPISVSLLEQIAQSGLQIPHKFSVYGNGYGFSSILKFRALSAEQIDAYKDYYQKYLHDLQQAIFMLHTNSHEQVMRVYPQFKDLIPANDYQGWWNNYPWELEQSRLLLGSINNLPAAKTKIINNVITDESYKYFFMIIILLEILTALFIIGSPFFTF